MVRVGRRNAASLGLGNIEFQVGDMADLGYPDDRFDAVVCVFGIFFVADMERQVAELWRMVRPGGTLAITTWAGELFEPAATGWWHVIADLRPDLHNPARPWNRLTDPNELRRLVSAGGIGSADIETDIGHQSLRRPEDWWAMVLGSGFQWTLQQLDATEIDRIRAANIEMIRDRRITKVDTSVLYATATKPA